MEKVCQGWKYFICLVDNQIPWQQGGCYSICMINRDLIGYVTIGIIDHDIIAFNDFALTNLLFIL